jgi:UDP-glucose 4-epimerase
MRVLLTGGAGFIGSHIADRLLDQGATVLIVDDLSSGKERNLAANAQFERVDIADPAFVTLARSFGADAIVHCAAQSSVVVSMKEPQFDARSNIIGGINVRDAAVAAGARQVVYINTGGALYGEPKYLPMDEQHPIEPTSAYGFSKWACEYYLRMLLPPAIPLRVLRLANIYGPRQDPYGEAGVVSIFGARMAKGETVTIFGDGEQTRDFVYVGDVARAVLLSLEASQPFAVNIATEQGTSVNELFRQMAAIMARLTGYERAPAYGPPRAGDVKHSVLSNGTARQVLGWSPEVSLPEGLSATIDWIRAHEV